MNKLLLTVALLAVTTNAMSTVKEDIEHKCKYNKGTPPVCRAGDTKLPKSKYLRLVHNGYGSHTYTIENVCTNKITYCYKGKNVPNIYGK